MPDASHSRLPESLGLELFHTGIVVDDLGASMATLSSLSGVRWAPPLITTTPMIGPTGHIPRRVRFTYSLDGPHHVELLQQLDTSAYEPLSGGRRIHHLGYVANDLEADAKSLDDAGFHMEMRGVDEGGAFSRATYHYSDLFPGMWLELVDRRTWTEIQAWIESARQESNDG